MFYSIKHITRYRYSNPISESLMELRMHPRSEGNQRCWNFAVRTAPRTRIASYRDSLNNTVHHFDVPGRHSRLTISAESLVEFTPTSELPDTLPPTAWDELDAMVAEGEGWEMLMPSHYAHPTELLRELAMELGLRRGRDPLSTLRMLNTAVYDALDYVPKSTSVDSRVDDVLAARRGVCQDFAHVMIGLVRDLGIPCRYVSGYLYHNVADQSHVAPDATHAWVEALLPDLGWVGFDPTNNILTVDRHIRTAVGRDYGDVPPTRGVFKGEAESELSVEVKVTPTSAPVIEEPVIPASWMNEPDEPALTVQQQQQQQQ